MKKLVILACLATTVTMTATSALAGNIKGRLGATGKIGFVIPADNNVDDRNNDTNSGVIGGAGLIYGINDNFAAEFDVTRSVFGSDGGDFDVTNFSFGGQYRFALPQTQFVPYVGAGVDILVNDFDPNDGASADVDTTVGIHASAGVDYFITKQLALTAETKLVVAPDADITGSHRGEFDPTSFSGTVGLRYFFN